MDKVTKEEMDYLFSKIDFSKSFLDAKAINIMNRVDTLFQPSRTILIDAIKGCTPSYKLMDDETIKNLGTFSASYSSWDWNYLFHEVLSDKELYEIYLKLKTEV